MNHVQSSSWLIWLIWLILVAIVVLIALCFRPVRVWLRSVYLYWRGVDLARKATKWVEYPRVGHALDQGYNNEKSRYKKQISRKYGKWGRWTQAPLEKRVETLKSHLSHAQTMQRELEDRLAEEKLSPPRQRTRVRDGLYYPAAGLLFVADVGFTYLCVQVLGLSPLFIFPMALILGGASWFLGDALGKQIEPEVELRTPEEKLKHRRSVIFLIAANVVICGITGTIRFSYTRRELHGDMITTTVSSVQTQGHANLGMDIISSYGILIAIILASLVLGWLHQSVTTEERIAVVKRRCARLEVLIMRANRTGLRATEAFQAQVMALQNESEVLRSRFHEGFDRTWKGRAPRGVQTPASPLEGLQTILKGLTWPPSSNRIEWPQQDVEIVDFDRYYDPYIEQQAAAALPQGTMATVSMARSQISSQPAPSVARPVALQSTVEPMPPPRPSRSSGGTPPPPKIG